MLENKSYYREGVALRMNLSFAFEFLCENFQPKLINSYSNFKRFFHFLLCDLGTVEGKKGIIKFYLFIRDLINCVVFLAKFHSGSTKKWFDLGTFAQYENWILLQNLTF